MRHGRQQRLLRIGPLEVQQAAQRPYPPTMRLPDQRFDVRIEPRIVPLQQSGLAWRRAGRGLRCRVMPGQLLLRNAYAPAFFRSVHFPLTPPLTIQQG